MVSVILALALAVAVVAIILLARRPIGLSNEEVAARLQAKDEERTRQLSLQAGQFQERLNEKAEQVTALTEQVRVAQAEATALRVDVTAARAALENERQQLTAERKNYEKVQAENETRFRDIAQKVLDASQEKMKRGGEECIGNLVAPLMKDIQEFRKQVDSVNVADAERVAKLAEKIEGLVSQTNNVSTQANELAQAIRGEAQVTGAWAEIQLKRILELSGLKETLDYTYQETFASEDSNRRNLRTDVLVKISDKEWIVIDSKNTMESYVGYVGAEGEARDELRKRIVESVKAHVDELKSAEYQKSLGKAFKYAFMYIPFEEVYLIAMKAEIKVNGEREPLREYARRNGVIFVNSTSLLPTLQLVAVTWQNQRSDRKAAKIKAECEGLCKKFETFLESYQDLGKALGKAATVYSSGFGQLASGKGNILGRFRKLNELDVPAAAELPGEDDYAEKGAKEISVSIPLIGAQEIPEAPAHA